jgi:hypothetical protein
VSHLVLRQQVTDQGGDVAPEELRGQVADHRAAHLSLADRGAVEEAAAHGGVVDHALLLHLDQHGGDRRRGEPALRFHDFVHLGDRRLAARPQHAHDGELQIAEPM